MCGIAGYYGTRAISTEVISQTLEIMTRRGPDNQSSVRSVFQGRQLTLLHSRLSIIDCVASANQPFESDDSLMSYNGELYNYIELRRSLERDGEKFRTNSDTEVFFKILCRPNKAVECKYEEIDGMWALAFFDKKTGELTLSRDFFGEKPLFIQVKSHGIYFGSSPTYIQKLSNSELGINFNKLKNFLYYDFRAFELDANSFADGVTSVKPGHELKVKCNGDIEIRPFFKPNRSNLRNWNFEEAKHYLYTLLEESFRRRFRSDVPISLFLSGGIDSAVISYISGEGGSKIKCFSIASDDRRYDESLAIDDLVKCYDLDHEYLLPCYEALDVYETLSSFSREGFSPIPFQNYLLFSSLIKKAKTHNVRVVLTGLGGDELFGGYLAHWRFYLYSIRDSEGFHNEYDHFRQNLYDYIKNPELREFDFSDHDSFRPEFFFEDRGAIQDYLIGADVELSYPKLESTSALKRKLDIDLCFGALPPHLRASDQVSMFHSVESRAPFLSKSLFEFARSLPDSFLMRNGFGKYILRKAFDRKLPNSVVDDHKKRGFNFDFSAKNIKGLNDLVLAAGEDKFLSENIDFRKVRELLGKGTLTNDESKLIFRIVSVYSFIWSIQ